LTLGSDGAETGDAQQYGAFALSQDEAMDLATGFRPYGFWRMELDAGHVFATESFFRIYGLEPHAGPVDIVEVSACIHPDDLIHLMRTFERAGRDKPIYESIFRVRDGSEGFKFVRAVGKFRTKPGTSGEVVGITYELFRQDEDEATRLRTALQQSPADLAVEHGTDLDEV
jgi:PAS domain-containing protein